MERYGLPWSLKSFKGNSKEHTNASHIRKSYSGQSIAFSLSPKEHLPGHPPIPVIRRTLSQKGVFQGVLPYPLLGGPWAKRVSSRASSHTRYWEDPEPKGCLPGHPPIPVIGRTLSQKGVFQGILPYPLLGGPWAKRVSSRASSHTRYWEDPEFKWACKTKGDMCFQEKQVWIGRTKGFCNGSSCEENTAPAISQRWG